MDIYYEKLILSLKIFDDILKSIIQNADHKNNFIGVLILQGNWMS